MIRMFADTQGCGIMHEVCSTFVHLFVLRFLLFVFFHYSVTMDDDGNDFFGLVQYSNDEEESASANAASDSESTSAITTTTKQSNAVTECTDMKDAKSVNPESVATDQDQEEYVEKNRVLLQLYVDYRMVLILEKRPQKPCHLWNILERSVCFRLDSTL